MGQTKILIVDDEEDLREVLEYQLSSLGAKIVLAANGREAFQLIQSSRFDAILSDITMPEMTGLDLLARVRGAGFDMPFVILTGFGDKTKAVEALRLGAFDFLEKPWDQETLVSTMRIAVEYGEKLRLLGEEMENLANTMAAAGNQSSSERAQSLSQMYDARKAVLLMRMQKGLHTTKTS